MSKSPAVTKAANVKLVQNTATTNAPQPASAYAFKGKLGAITAKTPNA